MNVNKLNREAIVRKENHTKKKSCIAKKVSVYRLNLHTHKMNFINLEMDDSKATDRNSKIK